MAIDAVKPSPIPQPPQPPEKTDSVAKQSPAGAPVMDSNVKMNPGQPPADEFKPSSKKQ